MKRRGFSLVGLLVALAVFAIGVIPLVQLLGDYRRAITTQVASLQEFDRLCSAQARGEGDSKISVFSQGAKGRRWRIGVVE